jgi:hypothetical protein
MCSLLVTPFQANRVIGSSRLWRGARRGIYQFAFNERNDVRREAGQVTKKVGYISLLTN